MTEEFHDNYLHLLNPALTIEAKDRIAIEILSVTLAPVIKKKNKITCVGIRRFSTQFVGIIILNRVFQPAPFEVNINAY